MLLQGTESLNPATQSIECSHWIATETDQTGSMIYRRARGTTRLSRLVNTSENLSKSRKILCSMPNQQAAAFHHHLTRVHHCGRLGLLQILWQPLNFL
ncbi:Vesicle transport through interaction with t-SNAREs-like protein 1B [Plecturocebus cupreus]